ncbi:MAG TPA: hypothetical protein VF490_19270 [Chryseosolibacter sp.]
MYIRILDSDPMGIIRNIAFVLALLVMVGHDVVPHTHDDDDQTSEQPARLPGTSNHGPTDIQHAFSQLQHAPGRGLVYLGALKRSDVFQGKLFLDLSFAELADSGLDWFFNYRKHRFWEHVPLSIVYKLKCFSLRGPPSF